MEYDEAPADVWCRHGKRWRWSEQRFHSPHRDQPDADAGAFPEECNPVYASLEAWQAAKDLGVV